MDLCDFLSQHHPLVLKEWEMYERRDQPPAVGSIVATLYDRFAGALPSGTHAQVVGRRMYRIFLECLYTGFQFHVSEARWWQEVYIVEEAI